ncbi:MAG: release factor glutamine methyltransferase [Candidatus Saccharimonadales bacterium]|jgi:release factor glutamine methyltransferase
MTIDEWINKSVKTLEDSSVDTAVLDAEVILADALDKDRSWLHAHPNKKLEPLLLARGLASSTLEGRLSRRADHEPLAYIRGKKEFYGREFIVSKDTLTPRPETETMIELLQEMIGDWGLGIGEETHVMDIGTGSGNIIITAALELSSFFDPQSSVSYTGLDISKPALKIAKQNAKKLNAKVEFIEFNLLTDDLSSILNPQSSILLANLPYVPEGYNINDAAKHEPDVSLFSGSDGLDHYRALFRQLSPPISNRQPSILSVYTEALSEQHESLESIANENGYRLEKTKDLIQVFVQK